MFIVRLLIKSLKKISKITKVRIFNKIANNIMSIYLLKKYSPDVGNYECNSSKSEPSNKIWICWFQGIDQAPKVVKACIKSVQENVQESYEVIIIDSENFINYVDIDINIINKFKKGIISNAQMSDILRVTLLYVHGGYWIDATIYMTKRIDLDDYASHSFISLRASQPVPYDSISEGLWTGYFIYASPGNNHIKYMRDFFYNYWNKETKLIDYFLIDYIFRIATKKFSEFENQMKKNNIVCNYKFVLHEYMLSSDERKITLLDGDNVGIYKLSHKVIYNQALLEKLSMNNLYSEEVF